MKLYTGFGKLIDELNQEYNPGTWFDGGYQIGEIWEKVYNEIEKREGWFPSFWGGLDNIVISKNKIKVGDIGCQGKCFNFSLLR